MDKCQKIQSKKVENFKSTNCFASPAVPPSSPYSPEKVNPIVELNLFPEKRPDSNSFYKSFLFAYQIYWASKNWPIPIKIREKRLFAQ